MQDRLSPLGFPPEVIARVAGHVRATKLHDHSSDPDTDLFTDADLGVLGSDPERYSAYADAIRKEYRRYPDLLYRPGRRKVLQHFLDMPRIFKTNVFHERYEEQARRNLEMELAALGG